MMGHLISTANVYATICSIIMNNAVYLIMLSANQALLKRTYSNQTCHTDSAERKSMSKKTVAEIYVHIYVHIHLTHNAKNSQAYYLDTALFMHVFCCF